jgi:metal-responsive CopG/Arc/MetJ family transcriptional regulator
MPSSIYLEDNLQRQLQDLAERTGKSPGELLREALTQYLGNEHHSQRIFKSLGAGDDPSLDAQRTHELLATAWGKR